MMAVKKAKPEPALAEATPPTPAPAPAPAPASAVPEPATPEPAPAPIAATRLSWVGEFVSVFRFLWDPKTVAFAAISVVFGFVLGWALLDKPLVGAAFTVLVVGLTYIARTVAFPQVSFGEFAAKAKETSLGAAIVLAAVILWCAVISALIMGRANAAEIPQAAYQHLPTLSQEAEAHWRARDGSDAPLATLAGLIDHETACPAQRTCWRADAMYKTRREEGVGLGMFTRAFNPNGTLRFDALKELKALHPDALAEANWERNKFNPRLQARALVLKVGDNYNAATRMTPHAEDRLAFAITMHNRGVQGVMNEVAACAITRGCDRTRWKGHVERTCTASRQIIPGTGRSACDISRAYAPDVARRAVKYEGALS